MAFLNADINVTQWPSGGWTLVLSYQHDFVICIHLQFYPVTPVTIIKNFNSITGDLTLIPEVLPLYILILDGTAKTLYGSGYIFSNLIIILIILFFVFLFCLPYFLLLPVWVPCVLCEYHIIIPRKWIRRDLTHTQQGRGERRGRSRALTYKEGEREKRRISNHQRDSERAFRERVLLEWSLMRCVRSGAPVCVCVISGWEPMSGG